MEANPTLSEAGFSNISTYTILPESNLGASKILDASQLLTGNVGISTSQGTLALGLALPNRKLIYDQSPNWVVLSNKNNSFYTTQQTAQLVGYQSENGTVLNGTYQVSISANGSVIASSSSTYVTVYRNNDGVYSVDASFSLGNGSGQSVSLSSNGTVLAVGAPSSNTVQVYTYTTFWVPLGSAITPPTGGHTYTNFGAQVSISITGTTPYVAISAIDTTSSYGVVFVYTYNGTSWIQYGTVINSPTTGNTGFGTSISSAGNVLAIGNPKDSSGVGDTYIYTYSTSWTLSATLTPATHTGASAFGTSVSLNSSGNTVAIGGPADNSNKGAVWVYQNNSGWALYGAQITPYDSGGLFGQSVSIYSDGNTVLIGAPNDNMFSVWQITLTTVPVWNQYLYYYGSPGIQFGSSVALASTDTTIAVTSTEGLFVFSYVPTDYISRSGTGYIIGYVIALDSSGILLAAGVPASNLVLVYMYNGTAWSQIGQTIMSPDTGAAFGTSVSIIIYNSLYLVAIGGPTDSSNNGAVWVYEYTGGSWVLFTPKITNSTTGQEFGYGVAFGVNSLGLNLAIGAPLYNSSSGALYIYVYSGSVWNLNYQYQNSIAGIRIGHYVSMSANGLLVATISPPPSNSNIETFGFGSGSWTGPQAIAPLTGATFTSNVSVSGNGTYVAIGGNANSGSSASVWVYMNTGSGTIQLGPTINSGLPSGQFGYSVSLSPDGGQVLITGINSSADSGNLWLFGYDTQTNTWDPLIERVTDGIPLYGTTSFFAGSTYTFAVGAPTSSASTSSIITYSETGNKMWIFNSEFTYPASDPTVNYAQNVSLSGNGSLLAVSGLNPTSQTYSYVFVYSYNEFTNSWSLLATLQQLSTTAFGTSISMSFDGSTLAVGAVSGNGSVGTVYVYTNPFTSFTVIAPSLPTNSNFGYLVSLSYNGKILAAGTNNQSRSNSYVYIYPSPYNISSATVQVGQGPVETEYAMQLSPDGSTLAISYPINGNIDIFTTPFNGSPVVVRPAGAGYGTALALNYNGTVLIGTDPTLAGSYVYFSPFTGTPLFLSSNGGTNYGYSAAISGNGITVAVGDQNLVWIYTIESQTTYSAFRLSGSGFGTSVALSYTGYTLAIGDITQETVYVYNNVLDLTINSINNSISDFGQSVSMSADGTIVAIGQPGTTTGYQSVYIYTYSPTTGTSSFTAVITYSVPNTAFGHSVSLSASGTELLVGNPADNSNNGSVGFYISPFTSGIIINAPDTNQQQFGYSVSLSGDGSTLAVGEPRTKSNTGVGIVYTYTSSGTQIAKITDPTNTSGGQFGCSVSLSANGSILAIGGEGLNSGSGAVYIYSSSGTLMITIPPPSEALSFGQSISLSGNGNTLAEVNESGPSHAFVYTLSPSVSYVILPAPPTGFQQPVSVYISTDGSTVFVGDTGLYQGVGTVIVYRYINSTWDLIQIISPQEQNTNLQFGTSVASSANGEIMVSGGPGDNLGNGSVWIYNFTLTQLTQLTNLLNNLAISANGTVLAIGRPDISSTLLYTYTNQMWSYITLSQNQNNQEGYSVALSADGTILLAGAPSSEVAYLYINGVYNKTLSPALSGSGTSVALSSNGQIQAIGAPGYSNTGAVVIYPGDTVIVGTASGLSNQGFNVALSSNGSILAFTAQYNGTLGPTFWIYTLINGTYKFTFSGSPFTSLAASSFPELTLSLSTSGEVVALCYLNNVAIYSSNNGIYTLQQLIPVSSATNVLNYQSATLTADGQTLAVSGNSGTVYYVQYHSTYIEQYSSTISGNINITNSTGQTLAVGNSQSSLLYIAN